MEEIVPKYILKQFEKIFSQEASQRLPKHSPWDHSIEMKPGWEPKGYKLYPLTKYEEDKLYKMIQEHLKRGTIRVSKSPQASPFFFVNKKEGDLRPIQDYRRLNEWMIKNKYPLPLIDNVIQTITKSGARIFSKFDVKWGYNNIQVVEGDE